MGFGEELLAEVLFESAADLAEDRVRKSNYVIGTICMLIGIVILVAGRNAAPLCLIFAIFFGLAFFGGGLGLVLIATFARKPGRREKLTKRILPRRRRQAHSIEAKRK
jgi:hypothetical protein